MTDILAQSTNLTTVVGDVFTIITGNGLLAYYAVVGVVIAGIKIFKRLKSGAR